MASPQLSIVGAGAESPGERLRRLQEEARLAAMEQVVSLQAGMDELGRIAAEIVDGGEAFPVGVRELCRNLGDDIAGRRQTLGVILQRHRPGH